MSYNRKIAFLIITIFLFVFQPISSTATIELPVIEEGNNILPNLYDTTFPSFNIMEPMTLSPMFTPDNAIHIYVDWINRANSTIDVQNQYITMWDNDVWATDSSPFVIALVEANQSRGVSVRVQVREDSDSDDIAGYLDSLGIDVRYMGTSTSTSDDSYLSATHNKMVLVDDKVSLISSINFGENAFSNNREAGMVIQSTSVTQYYKEIFEEDWADGEIPFPSLASNNFSPPITSNSHFVSHTDIPKANFTGTYNVTAFANPDNADEVIFRYLESAKESIYVSMYTISRPDFNETLIALKNANPTIDIQVLISRLRVGASENVDTREAVESLLANGIPVFNSSDPNVYPDTVNNYYHNKYWIIDGKHTFVYSGNWSPRSVTPAEATYSSGEANRDMGIAVHNAEDIASFYKSVWDQDVAVGNAWELPLGIKQTSFEESDVVSGTVSISAVVTELPGATVSYQWEGSTPVDVIGDTGFSESFDTTDLPNGITTFSVKAVVNGTEYTDSVNVNVVNYANYENWRFLITEVLPNPDIVSDNDGEFFELTNSFPFDLLIGGWVVGDNSAEYTFAPSYTIPAYSSLIIAKNQAGFEGAYGVSADIELSFTLANTEDYVYIKNNHDEYIDVVSYGTNAPDGSAQLDAPGAEISIQRDPLHIDTNQVDDFSFATPTPKATVPQVELGLPGDVEPTDQSSTPIDDSSSSDTAPVSEKFAIPTIFVLIATIGVKRKWKK